MMFKSEDTSLCQKLEEQGVLIRSCSNYRGLGEGFYRVAVKNHSHNLCLVEALKTLCLHMRHHDMRRYCVI